MYLLLAVTARSSRGLWGRSRERLLLVGEFRVDSIGRKPEDVGIWETEVVVVVVLASSVLVDVLVVKTKTVVLMVDVVENVSVTVESVIIRVVTDVTTEVVVVGAGVNVATGVETEVSKKGRSVTVFVEVEVRIDFVEVDACLVVHLIVEVVVEPTIIDPSTAGRTAIRRASILSMMKRGTGQCRKNV